MPKIEAFDRATVKVLSEELERAVQSVAEKYGIKISWAGGNFSPNAATIKLELAIIGGDGTAKTKEYDDLMTMAPVLDILNIEARRYDSQVGDFHIVGYRAKAHKKPFIIQTIAPVGFPGKRYVVDRKFIDRAELTG